MYDGLTFIATGSNMELSSKEISLALLTLRQYWSELIANAYLPGHSLEYYVRITDADNLIRKFETEQRSRSDQQEK